MKQPKLSITSLELCDLIVKGMQEKKGIDIVILDLTDVKQAIADYFIICSGNSKTQVDALADSVEEVVYLMDHQNPWRKEGKENKEWILLDYVDVVVHVFTNEKRSFYALEDLWGDAKTIYMESEKAN